MATLGQSNTNPMGGWFSRWWYQFQNGMRQALQRGDHTSMIIIWALLLMPALAFYSADFLDGSFTVIPIALISASLGYLLAWSRLSELLALLVSSSYGLAVIITTQVLALGVGSNPVNRASNYITQLNDAALNLNQSSTISDTTPLLMLFIALLAWFLAHNTVWHVFRIDRVWRVVLPPGALLLTIIWRYEGSRNLDIFVILFALLSLLLVVRSHVDAREYEWYRNKVRYTRSMRQYFLRVGAALALVFVLLAWFLPAGDDNANQDRIEAFLESLADITERFDDLFSPIESSGVSSAEFYGGDQLDLGGSIELGEREVLLIDAPPTGTRYYWRSTAFDTYVNGSWEHNRTVRATKEDGGLALVLGDTTARQNVLQSVELLLNTSSLIYAAPQPLEFVDVGVKVELDCVTNLGSFDCVNQRQEVDPSITRAYTTLREGNNYQVISSVSVATADQLRTASTNYPDWVVNKYLQGTEQVPRLQGLAAEIINQAGAVTPYDQAKAIERWLRFNITYNETIPFPPPNQDPVEWVVFDLREGYCNYYASAMVMMLRWQGIPARMSAGFSQGTLDASGRYLVRESDAHTWVEVYFPDYGWVNFEPTANEEELQREGDETPQLPPPAFSTSTPMPPTATPSPAPTSTPTPQEGGIEPQPQEEQQNEQLIQPTITPSPTPTFTPPPSPTPPPPLQDTSIDDPNQDSNILQTLLLFLFVTVAILLVGALLVAFIIWWVEYRGLGGLSIVEKAYARMAIYGKWLGIKLPPEHTPNERRQQLVKAVPDGKPPINQITSLYVEDRFAPPHTQQQRAEQASEAWTKARWAFIRQKFRRWFG